MSRRALLVGCCYPGTKVELHGCANDVKRMHQSLVTRFGFDESDILVMLDTDTSTVQPTGANIRSSLQKLIKGVQPGDLLVFHYSGHGTQVPPEDGSTDPEEAIVPTDMNLLTDDDFRELVDQIPGGAQFVFISDSCHSGGLIDAEKEQIGGTTTGYVGSGQGGGSHASAGGQGGGGGLMGLVSQGLQTYGGGRGGGGGAGGMMGMVSQGMAAFGNRDIQTRDFEYPGAGGGRRRDEGYGEDRTRRTEGYGEDAYEGRRRYGEEEYEGEGRRRRGEDEEYEGEGRRAHNGGRRHNEEEEYEGERRRRRPEEEYGGEAYEEGSGYEGRRQQAGYGGYGGSEGGAYGGGQGSYGYGQQQASPRSRTKEIPVSMLTQILSDRTGHKVDVGNIRTTIFDMFGDQASPTVKMFVNVVLQQLQQGGGGAQSGWMGTVSSLATQFLGSKLDSQDPAEAANYTRPAENAGPLLPRPQRAGKSTDVGILLSGCQSDETSADATPGHNSADSYGAFSNAIQTVLSQNDNPLTYRELVVEVRKVLAQQGFKQHPCLYCSDENADTVFLGRA